MVNKNINAGVTSMVLGIVSCALSFVPVAGLVCGILAIAFYMKSARLTKLNPGGYGGQGMAIAGLVTGIIGLFFSVILNVIYLIVIMGI